MIDIFKLDQKLFLKQIKLSRLVDIIKFYGIIITALICLKYLTSLPSKTFPLKEIIALSIAFLGFFQIRTDRISNEQVQMLTFFPSVNQETIKKYFLYKKPAIIYLVIIYLLFPVNFGREEILGFFFFLSIIMFMMFIDTLTYRLFPNSEIPNIVNVIIRIGYFAIFTAYLHIDNSEIDPLILLKSLDLWYLVLISSFFAIINPFVLILPNRMETQDD